MRTGLMFSGAVLCLCCQLNKSVVGTKTGLLLQEQTVYGNETQMFCHLDSLPCQNTPSVTSYDMLPPKRVKHSQKSFT